MSTFKITRTYFLGKTNNAVIIYGPEKRSQLVVIVKNNFGDIGISKLPKQFQSATAQSRNNYVVMY